MREYLGRVLIKHFLSVLRPLDALIIYLLPAIFAVLITLEALKHEAYPLNFHKLLPVVIVLLFGFTLVSYLFVTNSRSDNILAAKKQRSRFVVGQCRISTFQITHIFVFYILVFELLTLFFFVTIFPFLVGLNYWYLYAFLLFCVLHCIFVTLYILLHYYSIFFRTNFPKPE